MALIITLILLSVIAFMAIAFLVLSRGQKSSAGTATDQAVARDAATAAQQRALADLLTPIMISGNQFNFDLLVSTNYINPNGFVKNLGSSLLNVGYTYGNGLPLNARDSLQNLANLMLNPRPPVFIVTNTATGAADFRYYLDLNRNGLFEPSGWLTNGLVGNPSFYVGDPQWIGELEHPDQPHSADNFFISRYAYLVVPASKTLDLNYIHNYAKAPSPTMSVGAGDGFLRNQGVGSWEANLGAFLTDLNTNVWDPAANPYAYYGTPLNYTRPNNGAGFEDALALLQYRYAGSRASLLSANALFGPAGRNAFDSDFIDDYSAGPPMIGLHWFGLDPDVTRVNLGWPGADNTNHFFSPGEMFDPTKTSAFATHLATIGTVTNAPNPAIDLYNRYTFYRLLSQLGTDSAPEPPGKINLNYNNLTQTNALGLTSPTNFAPWRPIDFFTNAANKLLADAGYSFTVTNIPIFPTNYYTPSVHRLLQLAANIYDATTNRVYGTVAFGNSPTYPSVFRPYFRKTATGQVLIAGYMEVTDARMATPGTAALMLEPDRDSRNVNALYNYGTPPQRRPEQEPMISGIPLVIGVKKGFPSFNEFAMQTYIYVTRLLEFRRPAASTTGPIVQTNQMFVMAITNVFGLEAWNSYMAAYPRPLELIAAAEMTATMTNQFGRTLLTNWVSLGSALVTNTWPGWTNVNYTAQSFILPWGTNANFLFLTNATYNNRFQTFLPQTHYFERPSGFYIPRWWLSLNIRLRFILIDTVAQRIVDYVNLDSWNPPMDIMATLSANATCSGAPNLYNNPAEQWCTNVNASGVPLGVLNQIGVCLFGAPSLNTSFSMDPTAGQDSTKAIDSFRNNLVGWGPIGSYPNGTPTFFKSNLFYAPFDPYYPIYIHTSWQANDPLVHYTVGDLVDLGANVTNVDFQPHNPPLDNLGRLNLRYQPWGGNPFGASTPTIGLYQLTAKDPLVTRPDDWDFPTNKFPNVGWLGRVHRGTPWQTIYLKAAPLLDTNGWQAWTGNPNLIYNANQSFSKRVPANVLINDSLLTMPTNDWRILDLFSTALNDNSTRGQMSINQTGLAAWSAVLSGVNVVGTLPDMPANSIPIQPAGSYNPSAPILPPLVQIVNAINNTRAAMPNHAFQRLGDLLATPDLTIGASPQYVGTFPNGRWVGASPYLNLGSPAGIDPRTSTTLQQRTLLNDEVYERIPQQVLGLLRGGEQPRFVIYAYGQTLKPALHSIQNGGPFPGLCTNYQITAEVATRSVVRIDGAPANPHVTIESFNVLPPD